MKELKDYAKNNDVEYEQIESDLKEMSLAESYELIDELSVFMSDKGLSKEETLRGLKHYYKT